MAIQMILGLGLDIQVKLSYKETEGHPKAFTTVEIWPQESLPWLGAFT